MPDMHSRSPGLAEPPRSRLFACARSGVDALAFSSLLPAGAAAALLGAAAAALSIPTPWASVGIAAAGTLVVYNVDRLRDVARDRSRTEPQATESAGTPGTERGWSLAGSHRPGPAGDGLIDHWPLA